MFSFQLSLSGIAGVAVVTFCLFLWMFLIGIWAGQTIISPYSSNKVSSDLETKNDPVEIALTAAAPVEILLRPRERKKRIAPLVPEPYLTGEQ